MKICACNDTLRDDDPTRHVDPARDTHVGAVAFEVDFEQGPPPDPKERQVAEMAATLIDEALPRPEITADEARALSDAALPPGEAHLRGLSPEDQDLL